MRTPTTLALAALLAAGLAGTGCSATGADDGKLSIVASFYPLEYVAERLAGDRADVRNLVNPGVEPHDLELKPEQVAAISDADLLVYLEGFQPAVDEAAEQHLPNSSHGFDVATVEPLADGGHGETDHGDEAAHGHEEGGQDPHVWLDPTRYAAIADALAERLGDLDPGHRAEYTERAARLTDELAALDKEYTDGLADCERREIIVSHAAFGYLTERYRLEQVAIAGLSPDAEPTPQRLAEVIDIAREHGATVIFFETLVSPDVARTLADEVGAEAKVLDPLEGLRAGSDDDYFSVMRANLTALRSALECR